MRLKRKLAQACGSDGHELHVLPVGVIELNPLAPVVLADLHIEAT